jgi:hypothetical protein
MRPLIVASIRRLRSARRHATHALVALSCAGCVLPWQPTSTRRIDVLDFVIGDPGLWPRRGDMSQHQVVDLARREVCWPKHGNPRFFECWRWDDSYIYHLVDHAVDGNTGESYRFEDGRWMPRFLEGEWRLDVSTRIVWFDPSCRVNSVRSGPFRYHQRVWFAGTRDAGGDLGTRDTIVLEYAPEDPSGGPTAAERFYFARGAGWYEWTRGEASRNFNRVSAPAVSVIRDIVCP